MNDITIVLNAYKRSNFLSSQIENILDQTLQPKEIIISNNSGLKDINVKNYRTVSFNFNPGFCGRFLIAQLVETEYCCIIDDDIFLGKKYIEKCLNFLEKNEKSAIGVIGRIMKSKSDYLFKTVNEGISDNFEIVDWMGGLYFFKKEYFKYFWYENPFDLYGIRSHDDLHLAYTFQKYGNIKLYVSPFPENKKEEWGNINFSLGNDENASYKEEDWSKRRAELIRDYVNRGWKLINFIEKGNNFQKL